MAIRASMVVAWRVTTGSRVVSLNRMARGMQRGTVGIGTARTGTAPGLPTLQTHGEGNQKSRRPRRRRAYPIAEVQSAYTLKVLTQLRRVPASTRAPPPAHRKPKAAAAGTSAATRAALRRLPSTRIIALAGPLRHDRQEARGRRISRQRAPGPAWTTRGTRSSRLGRRRCSTRSSPHVIGRRLRWQAPAVCPLTHRPHPQARHSWALVSALAPEPVGRHGAGRSRQVANSSAAPPAVSC